MIRLYIEPLLAIGLTAMLGLGGLTRKVVIFQCSTPSAVLPLLYTIRSGTRPDRFQGQSWSVHIKQCVYVDAFALLAVLTGDISVSLETLFNNAGCNRECLERNVDIILFSNLQINDKLDHSWFFD